MDKERVFIVAEAGINCNGDISIAKKMIEQAKWAGADAIKFQKRDLDSCYTKEYLDSPRESPWGDTQREQKEGLEFDEVEYDVINGYCRLMDITWFASAWDLPSLKFLEKYDLKYNKVASPLLTHQELLESIAEQQKYTFISTGMSTLEEIENAVAVFKMFRCPFELMHCNSQYPLEDEYVNLKCIETLRNTFNCKVGYSCHSVDMIIPVYAAALGATSIEKHISLNRSMYGSDQSSSIEMEGFRRMIKYIRMKDTILGDGIKRITIPELAAREKLRRRKDYE